MDERGISSGKLRTPAQCQPGPPKGGNMRFFDDRDDTPEQIIGDVLGLVVYVAIMALILDAVIPH